MRIAALRRTATTSVLTIVATVPAATATGGERQREGSGQQDSRRAHVRELWVSGARLDITSPRPASPDGSWDKQMWEGIARGEASARG